MERSKPQTAGGPPRKGRHLGSIGKSASRSDRSDTKIIKFMLQSVARELAPHHAVRNCLRAYVPKSEAVEVWYGIDRKTAYYRNLVRCKSVWVCPLCAVSITEKRQDELAEKLSATEELPHYVGDKMVGVIHAPRWHLGMATFTIAHRRGVPLASVLYTLENAYKRCWGGRWAVAWKWHRHVVGTIRAIEVTYGKNGWHPHIHLLLVRDSQSTPRMEVEILNDLQSRWTDCVSMAGGNTDTSYGVDYRAATSNAYEYVSKLGVNVVGQSNQWNAIRELVKSPSKRGKKGSVTTWDMLAMYASGDVEAGELWIEAQRNLKGRRHLVASRGLYEKLGAYESTKADAVLAVDTQEETDILLASLTLSEWRIICQKDMRGQVVEVASRGDRKLLMDYLESIL